MGGVLHLVTPQEGLTAAAQEALHAVSSVPRDLLERTRIRPARANLLHAPWYRYARGGALTLGTTIHFTRIYFDPRGHADGSIASSWKWLQLLAHEVGHLPQAARFGLDAGGRMRYVAAFVAQYGARALTFRFPVHDGSPLEIEADLGRWVLLQLVGSEPLRHPLVQAVHANNAAATRAWCDRHAQRTHDLREQYRTLFDR